MIFLEKFNLFNKKGKHKTYVSQSRDPIVEKVNNVLLIEKLEIQIIELYAEITKLEKKFSKEEKSRFKVLIEKHELLLSNAKSISISLEKLEKSIIV